MKFIKRFVPHQVKWAWRVYKTVENWFVVLLSSHATARMRAGYEVEVGSDPYHYKLFADHVNLQYEWPGIHVVNSLLSFQYKGRWMSFETRKFGVNMPIMEVFHKLEYDLFVKAAEGRDVLDIGACIGETAVYFALNGAKKVYGYEPFPAQANLAAHNVALNKLQDKCEVVNAGVGTPAPSFKANLFAQDLFGGDVYQSIFWEGEKGDVPILSLEEVVNRHNLNDAYMKCDCDGFERQIIMDAPQEVLRRFSYIVIEYNYGADDIKAKLENAGFKVEMLGEVEGTYGPANKKFKHGKSGYLVATL